jgi:hypothetical protein
MMMPEAAETSPAAMTAITATPVFASGFAKLAGCRVRETVCRLLREITRRCLVCRV